MFLLLHFASRSTQHFFFFFSKINTIPIHFVNWYIFILIILGTFCICCQHYYKSLYLQGELYYSPRFYVTYITVCIITFCVDPDAKYNNTKCNNGVLICNSVRCNYISCCYSNSHNVQEMIMWREKIYKI